MGSSPLTRGKHAATGVGAAHEGLIPAHAGKTGCVGVGGHWWWAHPRSRGENREEETDPDLLRGSSPLTRGKRSWGLSFRWGWGLIPAHAGKTPRRGHGHCPRRAHPRSRGENFGQKANDPGAKGSSPLTRGKPRRVNRVRRGRGLIPAHAGKTPTSSQPRSTARAHPRSRGENGGHHTPWRTDKGSSPLTRGKHLLTRQGHVLEGLIPAHAGKTHR